MAIDIFSEFPAQLETLFSEGTLGSLTDGELLARFLGGDPSAAEAAFAVLVERHAAMVMRVCRGTLGVAHDAEDAAQAVFLVLARCARSVRRRDSVASWLHGVARRVAARARRDAARRRKHERRRAEMAATQASSPGVPEDLEGIYAAIDALPEIYRSAIVLCYLEGLTHEQAAESLRCPVRTLQSRLLRAKERLRDRMARRGMAFPAAIPPIADLPLPAPCWVKATASAARAFADGRGTIATAGVSSATIALARSSVRSAVHLPRLIAGMMLSAGLAALAVAVAGASGRNSDGASSGPSAADPPAQVAPPPAKDPNNRTLDLRVIDRDSRKAVAGVEVVVTVDSGARPGLGGDSREFTRRKTDPDGRCRIEFERELPKEIYIRARKAGYADRGYGPFIEPGGRAIPREHTIVMERGVAIGGIVKDRDGKPVAGATVIINARAGADGSPDWSNAPEAGITTDSEGRWRFGEMPTGWNWSYFRVAHPDYVPTALQRDFGIVAKRPRVAATELTDR